MHIDFPGGSDGKESACSVGDLGLIPGLGRSPGGGHGSTLQYSCLENPHGWRSLVGLQSMGLQRVWVTNHMLGAQVFLNIVSSCWIDSLIIIYGVLSLIIFGLKSAMSEIIKAIAFLQFAFAWNNFDPFIFNCMSPYTLCESFVGST